MSGLTLGNSDTLLTQRAADYLAAGPADPQALISHVCQINDTNRIVAEHMAAALFAGHQKFVRSYDGRWMLRDARSEGRGASSEALGSSLLASPSSLLANTTFSVVDVESTGSRAASGDRITEIAVVHVKNGVATTAFETLVNPERPIPPAIMALTNISWEMVKHAPRFKDVIPQLLAALEGTVFVAHNANFDWRFLSTEVERVTRRPLIGRRICTVKLARRLLPQLRRRNLDALQHYYGVENRARHRAGGDAEATAAIFIRMLKAARVEHECASVDDLERLASRASSRKKRKRRPPAMPHSTKDDGAS